MTTIYRRSLSLFSTLTFIFVASAFVLTTPDASTASPTVYWQEEAAEESTEEAEEETAEDSTEATGTTSEESTEEGAEESSETKAAAEVTDSFVISNLWIMLAGMLVFIMHLGFATLESGLTRSKNTVNILFKNTAIVCLGLITYAVVGFNIMYPGFAEFEDEKAKAAYMESSDDASMKKQGYFAFAGPGFVLNDADTAGGPDCTPAYGYPYTLFTDFFFQAMFAATCCTIVSGAVAGRIKLGTFLIFCLFFVSVSYPITGSWKWGLGWLHRIDFVDFAGSTLVHSVGGWGALVMALLLGPRTGKYVDGKAMAIQPSNMPMATIGVFLLWFGWFGFNGGSVLSADPGLVSLVLCTTSMAAAAGGLAAALISTVHGKKPDLSMTLNGILAGLVGITAGADQMSLLESIIIGAIAGVLVYIAVIFIDGVIKIDDPVGAISVHLVCGIWGTLAVGLFGAAAGADQLKSQVIGIVAIGAFTVGFCFILGLLLKVTMGLRVPLEEEQKGLDLGEHGIHAYSL